NLHERLVERDERVRETADAPLVAERFAQGLPEHDADVFHGVVQVDLEVAFRLHGEVEPAVLAELFEHVVEERDAGGHRCGARTVDRQREVDGRLLRLAAQRRFPLAHDSRSWRSRRAARAPLALTVATFVIPRRSLMLS